MLNRDPYEVLSVPRNATQEEIRSAYRALVKKYHPDKYQGNPLADLAQEKLQEINEAYEILTKNPSQADPSASYGYGTGSGYSGYTSGSTASPLYNQIRSAINRNDLGQAQSLLDKCTIQDAEWNFLTGILAYRQGKISEGISHVQKAMEMDPNNQEYRAAYAQLNSIGSMYRTNSAGYGYGNEMNPSDMLLCSTLPFCLCC